MILLLYFVFLVWQIKTKHTNILELKFPQKRSTLAYKSVILESFVLLIKTND